jgi:hypothetical protein
MRTLILLGCLLNASALAQQPAPLPLKPLSLEPTIKVYPTPKVDDKKDKPPVAAPEAKKDPKPIQPQK